MEERQFDFDGGINESLAKKTRESFSKDNNQEDLVEDIGNITIDDAESILVSKIDDLGLHLTNYSVDIKEGKEVYVERFNPDEGLNILMTYSFWEPLKSDRYQSGDFPSWLGGNPAIRMKVATYTKDNIIDSIKAQISVRCCSKYVDKDIINFELANPQKRLMDILYVFEQIHKKRADYVDLLDKKYQSEAGPASHMMGFSTNPIISSKQVTNSKYVNKFEDRLINGWDKVIEAIAKDCGATIR